MAFQNPELRKKYLPTCAFMKFVGDFHIHSKYARATSKDMNVENLDKWAKTKGIGVISPGDFTHPVWFKELQEKLEPTESGLYKLKGSATGTRFLLTTEISCIYSQGGKMRRVHMCLIVPEIQTIEKIIANSKCSFTWDWIKIVDCLGEMPQASQSITLSRIFSFKSRGFSYSDIRACQSATIKKQSYSSCNLIQLSSAPTRCPKCSLPVGRIPLNIRFFIPIL